MINHWFECTKNHIFESTIDKVDDSTTIPCKIKPCKSLAKRIYLSPAQSRNARNFTPSLLYVNSQGHVIAPGRNDPDHLPASYRKELNKNGYKEITINNFREYETFQRSQRSKLKDQKDIYLTDQQAQYDQTVKQNIEALRNGGIIELPNPDGSSNRVKVPPLKSMHPSMQRLAEYAIKQAEEHRIKAPDSNPMIGCMEYDSKLPNSDVDAQNYRDKDTGGRKKWF
jgi:hypothetical protein